MLIGTNASGITGGEICAMNNMVILQKSPDLWSATYVTGTSRLHSSSPWGKMSLRPFPSYDNMAACCFSDIKMVETTWTCALTDSQI